MPRSGVTKTTRECPGQPTSGSVAVGSVGGVEGDSVLSNSTRSYSKKCLVSDVPNHIVFYTSYLSFFLLKIY